MAIVYVAYDGKWENNAYVDHKLKVLMVSMDKTCLQLQMQIAKSIGIEEEASKIRMLYNANLGTSKGVEIENDSDVEMYLYLVKNEEEYKKCPIIVEIEETTIQYSEDSKDSVVALYVEEEQILTTTLVQKTKKRRFQEVEETETSSSSSSVWESLKREKENMEIITKGTSIEDLKENLSFESKEDLKEVLSMIAIKKKFQYRVPKSDKKRFMARCIDEKCEWYLSVRVYKNTTMYKVCTYKNVHTCSLEFSNPDHRQASSHLISKYIQNMLGDPKVEYKTNQVISDVKRVLGVTVNYQKAWRAMQNARDEVLGPASDSYGLLPSYCHVLKKNNPGSVTKIMKDSQNRFKFLFVAYGVSIEGWKHCRPVIVVDGTFLKAKHGGILFVACAKDGNNGIFPLAFGVGESENNEAWEWFFTSLKEAIGGREELCIVSDRHLSIANAIKKVYPEAHHGICMHHLKENLIKRYMVAGLHDLFFKAARAYRHLEFEKYMSEMSSLNPKIKDYLLEIGPGRWARCLYPRRRYNIQTSNIAESINSAVKEAREQPILKILDELRKTFQNWFLERSKLAASTFYPVTTWAHKEMRDKLEKANCMEVEQLQTNTFNVKYNQKTFFVDLEKRTCTCRQFDLDEIPCSHAIAGIDKLYRNKYEYCSKWYDIMMYKNTYNGSLNPVGDKEDWNIPEDIKQEILLPPIYKPAAGRRKKQRYKSATETFKMSTKCGRCRRTGHNRKTCKFSPAFASLFKEA
ncbi:hypothetical protein UlMin_045636 [Ulmus minor]